MISIYDNFINPNNIERLHNFCTAQAFTVSGKSRGTPTEKYQDRDLSLISLLNKTENHSFLDDIQNDILNVIGTHYSCFRRYINAFKFSDASLSHVDYCKPNTECKTAIIYCNGEWDVDWGGETVFLDSLNPSAEIIKSVIPKPGRMVVFESQTPHIARVPNLLYPKYRYTLVYNFSTEIKKIID